MPNHSNRKCLNKWAYSTKLELTQYNKIWIFHSISGFFGLIAIIFLFWVLKFFHLKFSFLIIILFFHISVFTANSVLTYKSEYYKNPKDILNQIREIEDYVSYLLILSGIFIAAFQDRFLVNKTYTCFISFTLGFSILSILIIWISYKSAKTLTSIIHIKSILITFSLFSLAIALLSLIPDKICHERSNFEIKPIEIFVNKKALIEIQLCDFNNNPISGIQKDKFQITSNRKIIDAFTYLNYETDKNGIIKLEVISKEAGESEVSVKINNISLPEKRIMKVCNRDLALSNDISIGKNKK